MPDRRFPGLPPTAAVVLTAILGACAPVDTWSEWRSPAGEARLGPTGVLAERVDDGPGPLIPAEGPIELTVEQATILALQNNRDLAVQRLTPEIVATFEQIERGEYDPQLFARAEYFEDEAQETSRATGETFSATRTGSTTEAGVIQRLPTGTDVELSVSADRDVSNRAPEQQVARAGLTVTQALLQGFGPAVNLASIRQAELDTLASLYELEGFAEALVADTESTYWRYALAAERIRIVEESLAVARRQQEEVEQRIEIGVSPPTEAASARAEVAQREQDLIDARSALESLELQLLRLVNPGGTAPALERDVVALSSPVTEPHPIEDLDERLVLARRSRPDLNEARLRLDQRRLETVVTRNGLLPRLDLFLTLGKTGYAGAFSDAVREVDGGPGYDLTAGLEFSYPLGNRTAEGFHRNALLSRQQALEAIDNLEQIVEQDVRLAAVEVERARRQIAATAATRALREEALRAETERFRVGQSTSLLVAQAQRDLLEAQINEVDAVVAYRLALIQLYLAEGTLLERRGLTVMADQAASGRAAE